MSITTMANMPPTEELLPCLYGLLQYLLPLAALGLLMWWVFWRPIAHLRTPEQRRATCPWMAESGDAERRALLPPPLIAVDDQQLKQSSGYYQLQGATIAGKVGGRLFYTVTTPASGEVRCVITFVHGFADSQGYVHQNTIRAHAQRLGACVIGVDMPGHGLSDGLIVHIPDWFEFIGAAEEFMEKVSRPMCRSLATKANPPLRHFAQGISMGGGILASIALRRPELFDGMILDAPMLFVADDIKPPWVVQMLFKHLIIKIPLLATWPVAPSKDLLERCFASDAMKAAYRAYPLVYSTKPRLLTAYSLAFQCPEWLELHLHEINTPFLIIHGAADQVTDPALSQKMHDVAATGDKTLKLYPGVMHADCMQTLQAYKDVEAWLSKRM